MESMSCWGGRTRGAYLHIAFRRETERDVVLHMRAMTNSERKFFRR